MVSARGGEEVRRLDEAWPGASQELREYRGAGREGGQGRFRLGLQQDSRCSPPRRPRDRQEHNQEILLDHGIGPAPELNQRTSWKAFIKAHLGELAAADFFTADVLSLAGLVRYFVFFVIDIKTQRVEIAGITTAPHEGWMKQIARNLTDVVDGFLRGTRCLILDRDPLYTGAFRRMLSDSGVKPLRLPARSPNLNADAERFVLSAKSECLSRIVPLSEVHPRRSLIAFSEHYHFERHHQGLGGGLIVANANASRTRGHVACGERFGGMLRFDYREAA